MPGTGDELHFDIKALVDTDLSDIFSEASSTHEEKKTDLQTAVSNLSKAVSGTERTFHLIYNIFNSPNSFTTRNLPNTLRDTRARDVIDYACAKIRHTALEAMGSDKEQDIDKIITPAKEAILRTSPSIPEIVAPVEAIEAAAGAGDAFPPMVRAGAVSPAASPAVEADQLAMWAAAGGAFPFPRPIPPVRRLDNVDIGQALGQRCMPIGCVIS